MRIVLLFLVAIAGTPAFADDETGDDYAGVRYAVTEFITGIREGDAARIAAVSNLEHGHAIWPLTREGETSIVSVTLGKMIEDLQAYEGYGEPHRFAGIDIIGGELAVANVVSHAPQADGAGVILEFFVLAKVDGAWQVIALPWIFRPELTVAG